MKLLASLLLLAPALAIPAPQDSGDRNKCMEKTDDFKGWDIEDFKLKSTTSHMAPIFSLGKSVSELTFKVKNDVIGYSVDCKATGSADLSKMQKDDKNNDSGDNHGEFDGEYKFNCNAPKDKEADGDVIFSFDEGSGELHLTQEWSCGDDDGNDSTPPISYTGKGTGKAELDCETGESEVNKMWKVGSDDDFSSRKKDCKKTNFHVELEALDAP